MTEGQGITRKNEECDRGRRKDRSKGSNKTLEQLLQSLRMVQRKDLATRGRLVYSTEILVALQCLKIICHEKTTLFPLGKADR